MSAFYFFLPDWCIIQTSHIFSDLLRNVYLQLSAQESRRKRKEYMDALEHKVQCYYNENSALKLKVFATSMFWKIFSYWFCHWFLKYKYFARYFFIFWSPAGFQFLKSNTEKVGISSTMKFRLKYSNFWNLFHWLFGVQLSLYCSVKTNASKRWVKYSTAFVLRAINFQMKHLEQSNRNLLMQLRKLQATVEGRSVVEHPSCPTPRVGATS